MLDPANVYSATSPVDLSPSVAEARPLVYVPSAGSPGGLTVIDPQTLDVIATYRIGNLVQHVVPSWDLRTLYANASASNRLVPIDPATGVPSDVSIPVQRPYNLYFTPDGTTAVVMNEQNNRIDFYDPYFWAKQGSTPVPCRGVNHADWSADGAYFIATCEFSGQMLKVDTTTREILGVLDLPRGSMPQDVRLVPDGSKFYVADMEHDGLWIIDGETFQVIGEIATGRGAHGIYPSRDARVVYVANRGRHEDDERRRSREGDGSVSVVDPAADSVLATWGIPGGGSPDMGGVSADGTRLWLSGRYDAEVYVFDTADGSLVARIPVLPQPHGLAVWPQPGRYSLGHTGNMR